MKKLVILLFSVVSMMVHSQAVEIEKILETKQIASFLQAPIGSGPVALMVEEIDGYFTIINGVTDGAYRFLPYIEKTRIENIMFNPTISGYYKKCGDYYFASSEIVFEIQKGLEEVYYTRDRNIHNSGISFILKKPPHYVAFFVNDKGEPHAADTSGKIYDSAQTMALLKALDPEKYRQSRERAEELGLEEQFLANKVLVWGKTYYSTPALYEVTMPGKYAYISNSDQLQYDLQGNGYQASFHSIESSIVAVNPDGERFLKILINEHSKIMTNYKPGQLYTTSTYVGFGGNIYFYVAGEEFTEVFRIRRTWGEPDFYAMAVNGYTEDAYGTYVKKVLKGLSKEELRLLRNHLFALYGYVFKDAGLKACFDKLVWYEGDPKATMDSIKLPPERQALLEMILAEEKKR